MRRVYALGTLAVIGLVLWQVGPALPVMTGSPPVFETGKIMAGLSLPARVPRRLLVSGHSLTDHPYPEYLEGIAASLGSPMDWNMQALEGSSIKDRTMGSGPVPWAGYAAGTDRDDRPLDMLAQLRRPLAPGERAYDTLVITEQHTLLGSIVWNDSLRLLRDFHERVIAQNPDAQTYLFEAWMNVVDLDDPSSWIAYERAAAPLWRCVAGRVNHDLVAEGRADRLATIPAASALTVLVEEATSHRPVPGLEGPDTRSILARIFRDDVHLTSAGVYYIALVSSAILQGQTIHTSVRPQGMRKDTADRLQQIAARFVTAHRAERREIPAESCSRYVSDSFAPRYLAYQRSLQWRDYPGPMIWLKWARLRVQWPRLFRRRDASNPLYISEAKPPVL